jgi:hypothetical protein
VIGLHRTSSDQGFRAFFPGITQQIFQFPGFIAAKSQPSLIISFNQQTRTL